MTAIASMLAAVAFVAGTAASKATVACPGTGTACSMALAGTAAIGDDVLVGVSVDTSCTVSSVTDTGSNTYAQKVTNTNVTQGQRAETWGSHLTATATSVTVNYSGSCNSQFTEITAAEYSGVAAYGNTGGGSANASSTVTATVVLQNAANSIYSSFWISSNTTYTATAGTARTQQGSANGTIGSMDRNGTGTVTATTGVAGNWATAAVELCATSPCAGAGGTTPASMMGFWGVLILPPSHLDALPPSRRRS